MQHAVRVTPPPAPGRRDRPSRSQVEPAALALLARHSAGLLATARRYSASPEDAEDAYQRGVEILLTKAPSTSEEELLPWLRTVVKHEAFAVRKARRAHPQHGAGIDDADPDAWTDQRAERYEQLRVGAEAMANLKPQELRCLLLRAEGLSYREICTATGWTYTKVNRAITEGRRAFLKRVTSIETGAECDRLTPLISKAVDGEASAQELALVRPHLKRCIGCRSTLREYRAAPARVAGLLPPVAALASPGGGAGGFVMRALHALQSHIAGLGDLAGAQKAAAVAASAALLAGGGVASVGAFDHDAPPVPRSAFAHRVASAPRTHVSSPTTGAVSLPAAGDPDPFVPAPAPESSQTADPASDPAPAAADRGPEFDPGTSPQPAPRTPSPAPKQDPGRGEFGP